MSDLLETPPVITISIPLPGKTKTIRAVLYVVMAVSSFTLLIISATVSPPTPSSYPYVADETYLPVFPSRRPIVSDSFFLSLAYLPLSSINPTLTFPLSSTAWYYDGGMIRYGMALGVMTLVASIYNG